MSIFNFKGGTFKVDKKKENERMRLAGLKARKRLEEKKKARLTATQAKALTSGTGVKFTKKK